MSSSKLIIESEVFSDYDLILLDSSQNSHPPPTLMHRMFSAVKRIKILLKNLIFKGPDAALIFASDGASAIEKGVMVFMCNLLNTKSLIFPRAGNLVNQTKKSSLFLFFIKFLYRNSSVFLCQGPKWKSYATKILKIKKENTLVINNWTATDPLIEIGEKRNYAQNEQMKVLFVGWLEDFKGVFELLGAAKILLQSGKNIQFTFVGNGSAMNKAKVFAKESNIEKNIVFAGWKSGDELHEYYKNNNILLLPSWSEGLPNAAIEAMAAGLAVVTTKLDIPEVFTDHENSILIEPYSELEIYESLERLICDYKLRIEISKKGHQFAKDNFSEKGS